MRGLCLLVLTMAGGCASEVRPEPGDDAVAASGKADDAREVALEEFAGSFGCLEEDGGETSLQSLEECRLTISITGDEVHIVDRIGGHTARDLTLTLDGDPLEETSTVEADGWTYRRKVVQTLTRVGPDAIEYRGDVYLVPSYQVWSWGEARSTTSTYTRTETGLSEVYADGPQAPFTREFVVVETR